MSTIISYRKKHESHFRADYELYITM